jgi:GR25 family glycosyltransferase involved in LPS biosynthesis
MSGLKRIESLPAYCITLERRSDRWKRFQDQPGIASLNVKKFLGVDGKKLNVNTDKRIATLTRRNIVTKTRRSHEELDSIGGVGCALSHIALWQHMVDNNMEMCLIFEDDALIPADFVEKTNTIIANSMILKDPTQWDIFLLGGRYDDASKIPGETKLIRVEAFVLFHAYIITLSTAKQLLKDVFPICAHIDIFVSVWGYLNKIRIVTSPYLNVKQNVKIKTDIQTEDNCDICDIPTDFTKTHKMISYYEWRIAQVAELIILGGIGYYLYKRFIK